MSSHEEVPLDARRLPFWLRASLWWGSLLLRAQRLWQPLFAVHVQRARVLWWAENTGAMFVDSLDRKAREAVSVVLEPSPGSGEADPVDISSELED